MTTRIVIDPITRIEGHSRIEASWTQITRSPSLFLRTMVRGIETILRGRDPREAWAICSKSLRCLYHSSCLCFHSLC